MTRAVNHQTRKASTPKPAKTPATEKKATTTKAAEVKATQPKQKKDDFGKLSGETVTSTTPKADTVTPALNRAFFTLAKTLETEDLAGPLAMQAAREFAKSPEAMAAFKQAIPYLESGAVSLAGKVGAPVIANVAKSALPLVANGQTVKALLKAAYEVGGPNGRRLVGAALRGLNAGKGMSGAAAEIAATAAKIGAKAPALGAVAGGLGKALPVIGNALNVVAVAASVKDLCQTAFDPTKTKGQKLAQVLHLAATITGCFIPPAAAVAVAIDVKKAVG